MRDLWMIFVFLGGIIAGASVGAVYHFVAAKSLTQTLDMRDSEIGELKKTLERENKLAVKAHALAAAKFDKLQRGYDALQVELAEQKQLATLQRQHIAKFLQGVDEGETVAAADEQPEPEQLVPGPSDLEDGRIRGGKIAYHKLKMAPVEGEFQVTGEIENLSKKRFRSLILHIELFGAGSRWIEVLPISIDGLEPGATRAFTVAGLTNRPDLYDAVKKFKITTALLSEDRSNSAE